MPLNVRAVLEEKSEKYLSVFAYGSSITDKMRVDSKEQRKIGKSRTLKKSTDNPKSGTSEIMLGNLENNNLKEPVVIPSAIGSNTKKIVKNNIEPEPEKENIQELNYYPTEIQEDEENDHEIENDNQEEIVQPVKRGRGRPKKVVTEPVEQAPKRRRGRPRKNEVAESNILPGVESIEEKEENVLPGFEEEDEKYENVLPGFGEEDEETLPGLEDEEIDEKYESILPGFEDVDKVEERNLSTFENTNKKEEVISEVKNVNNNDSNISMGLNNINTVQEYEELDMNRILSSGQKMVAFVGTSKNGTSFLVNNVAEILAMNNVKTAILDLTQNRNAYYIYTKNEEDLRVKANDCIKKLKNGIANGVEVHKNLTVYTSAFDVDEIENVEPIVETLLKEHDIILLDCDFNTPDRYFKYSQEIYIVQSMDILTIQPLTLFLRKLSDKGYLEESKIRVVLNKYIRTKELNEDILVGGISIYNDAGMTVRKELFNRRTVKRITIPFEVETYLRYLNGLVICDVSLKGYSKKLLQSLKQLATLVYSNSNSGQSGKYVPPSAKNSTFSPSMNSTLEQMSKRY